MPAQLSLLNGWRRSKLQPHYLLLDDLAAHRAAQALNIAVIGAVYQRALQQVDEKT